jgi:hypothetical protein
MRQSSARNGDSGIVDDEWGLSAFTPDWLAGNAGSCWRVVQYAEGRNEGNQDVYVLQRAQAGDEPDELPLPEKAGQELSATSQQSDHRSVAGRSSSPHGAVS